MWSRIKQFPWLHILKRDFYTIFYEGELEVFYEFVRQVFIQLFWGSDHFCVAISKFKGLQKVHQEVNPNNFSFSVLLNQFFSWDLNFLRQVFSFHLGDCWFIVQGILWGWLRLRFVKWVRDFFLRLSSVLIFYHWAQPGYRRIFGFPWETRLSWAWSGCLFGPITLSMTKAWFFRTPKFPSPNPLTAWLFPVAHRHRRPFKFWHSLTWLCNFPSRAIHFIFWVECCFFRCYQSPPSWRPNSFPSTRHSCKTLSSPLSLSAESCQYNCKPLSRCDAPWWISYRWFQNTLSTCTGQWGSSCRCTPFWTGWSLHIAGIWHESLNRWSLACVACCRSLKNRSRIRK